MGFLATRRRYHELLERLALEAVERARLGLSTNYLTLPARENFPDWSSHDNVVSKHLTIVVSRTTHAQKTESHLQLPVESLGSLRMR